MKNKNYVNLDVNPCKMCMPLGSALAFKGMEGAMVMMHGSQGCSTYMRRHISTHYNEPVDIASSSLNEKGTVYGGAANLKKGFINLIKMYSPKLIGVATTCLAETIGEDIDRIIEEFKLEEKIEGIEFIAVSSPGYGGSQYEGYYKALRKTVEVLAKEKTTPNGKINIIAGLMTPADIRELKYILEQFGVEGIILPDISETLDAPYIKGKYERIPEGGTTIKDIKDMANSVATIEMGYLIDGVISPGTYLSEKFGVPLYKCKLPIGLANSDKFIKLIAEVTGKEIPLGIKKERGRMLDGMIDSHKYNGEGKAALFGEPELLAAVYDLLSENGIFPAVVATGTKLSGLSEKIQQNSLWKNKEDILVLEDSDFNTIREESLKRGVNILVGTSEGAFMEEKDGFPLVRIGFPVHDRVGTTREINIGYRGSMMLLDKITNALLERKHGNYRAKMYDKYFEKD